MVVIGNLANALFRFLLQTQADLAGVQRCIAFGDGLLEMRQRARHRRYFIVTAQ